MVPCGVLKMIDPMWSVLPELHATIVPPSPIPFRSPYFQISFLGHGILSLKAKYSGDADTISMGKVITFYFPPMLQQTDCGYFNPHFGNLANVLYPIITIFSSSKSLFTASTVITNGKPTVTACLSVANLNLNCAAPVSYPVGYVPALTTVRAGMSIGDYLAGALAGLLQMAIEIAFSYFFSFATSLPISNVFPQSLNSLGSRLFLRSVSSNIHVATPLTNALGRYLGTTNAPIVSAIIGNGIGSELLSVGRGIVLDKVSISGNSIEDYVYSRTNSYAETFDSIYGTGPENSF